MNGQRPGARWRRWRQRRREAWAEHRLDRMIDALNEERRPPEPVDDEERELLAVARMLKALRPAPQAVEARPLPRNASLGPAGPVALNGDRRPAAGAGRPGGPGAGRRLWRPAVAGLVLVMVGLSVLTPLPRLARDGLGNWLAGGQRQPGDVVHAMERAVAGLTSYHGVVELRSTNAEGELWLWRRIEIWVDGDRYVHRNDQGMVTVHDGNRLWQVRPEERVVAVLPPIPDRYAFDLRQRARYALRYPHTVAGREQVAGREAVRLRIHPPGGLPYDLWIDAETFLPLRERSAMQNGLQTEIAFVQLETNVPVDPALFAFEVPEGYRVEEHNPGQLVDTPAEAAAIAGFDPLLPDERPRRLLAAQGQVVLDYGETVIVEEPARGDFEPQRNAALGSVGESPLEVVGERLRWRQQGLEITVEGPRRVELARALAPGLQLPDEGSPPEFDPEVDVAVDMETERNMQQQVDGGHSPYMIDPVQAAGAFLMGRFGDQMGDAGELVDQRIRVVHNDGVRAIVEVQGGPAARVYLQRLVRQDHTGIWTVVGYDPR